jgi:hypothetical protein
VFETITRAAAATEGRGGRGQSSSGEVSPTGLSRARGRCATSPTAPDEADTPGLRASRSGATAAEAMLTAVAVVAVPADGRDRA